MKSSTILKTGAIICGLTVVIGAFGAHALKPILEANDRVSPFETGVLYQMFHGLAILVLGIFPPRPQGGMPKSILEVQNAFDITWINRAYWCFLLGTILFSGSLYGLAIWPAMGWLGPVTPIGGLFFVGGWGCLLKAIRANNWI